jgi:tRNA threonylcarbamoyladenosine biosynthesis protein TsaE
MLSQEHVTQSEQETFDLAAQLGARLRGDEVILLEGELGAGKTVFTRGLAAGLGMEDTTQVCSPSFTLVNVYYGRVTIFHMDLYRIARQSELSDLGWEDFLGQGVVVVEWAERLDYEEDAVRVRILIGEGDERRLTISEGSIRI